MNKSLCLFLAFGALLALSAGAFAAELNSSSTLADSQPAGTIAPSEPRFSKAIEDLPLMPELTLLPDNDVLFIIPRSGRIAESSATGIVDVDSVYKFYRRTLPQMGWTAVSARLYTRAGEQLKIDAHADGKETRVTFSVTPRASEKE